MLQIIPFPSNVSNAEREEKIRVWWIMKYPVACMFTMNVKLTSWIFFHPFYRHKRKVQNFLPCKTPTRGPLDPSVMPVGHSVTYEDPDIHMGHHRPLVMRQHPLNVEVSVTYMLMGIFDIWQAKWFSTFEKAYSAANTLMRLSEISISEKV